MRKLSLISTALAVVLFAAPAFAQEEATSNFSTTLTFTTDYVDEGISNSDEQPAIQGSFNWDNGTWYAGLWGSNVDVGLAGNSTEFDLYAGYKFEAFGIGHDVGVTYYTYPGAKPTAPAVTINETDYVDVHLFADKDFGMFGVNGGIEYSPDFNLESGNSFHYFGGVTVPFMEKYAFSAKVGHRNIEDNVAAGLDNYTYYNAGFGANCHGFDFDLRYWSSNSDLVGGVNNENGDDHVVFSVSKTF